MKNYLLLLFAILLFVGCTNEKESIQKKNLEKAHKTIDSITKDMKNFGPDLTPKDVTIEVMLIKEVPEGATDLKDYIQFYNRGESVGSIIGKPNEFTTIVYGGKKVKWKGIKFDTLKKPKIKLITKEKGGDFINWKGNNKPSSDDEIKLHVKSKDSVTKTTDIKYTIEITINGTTYPIDPILKFH